MPMLLKALRFPFLFAATLLAAPAAFAQDEEEEEPEEGEEDALDDILNDPSGQTAREERQDVEQGDFDDRPGVASTSLPEEDRSRRVIKTLQRKTFLKIG